MFEIKVGGFTVQAFDGPNTVNIHRITTNGKELEFWLTTDEIYQLEFIIQEIKRKLDLK